MVAQVAIYGPVTVALANQIYNNQVTVGSAGTRVQFSTISIPITQFVTVIANANNTGLIYVGNSTVSSTNGLKVSPGQSIPVPASNLNLLYVDAANNGDGMSWLGC